MEFSTSNADYDQRDSAFERILVNAGFVPISKIHTRRDNNIIEAAFIKVVSRGGYVAYVQLDIEGGTKIDNHDTIVVQTTAATNISTSIKHGLYECARSRACGVLFVCRDGICTLTGQATPEAEEKVYVIDDTTIDVVTFGQYPIPFPVVLMSTIPLHPEVVQGNIRIVSESLLETVTNHCSNNLRGYDQSMIELHSIFSQYCTLQTNKSRLLLITINKLQRLHDKNVEMVEFSKHMNANAQLREHVQSTAFKNDYHHVYSNLVDKRQKYFDLIRICHSITDSKSLICDHTLRIKEIGDQVNEKYTGIENPQEIDPNTMAGIVAKAKI